MRCLIVFVALIGVSFGAEEKKAGVPAVEAVISEKVAGMPAPQRPAVPKGVGMAITTASKEAQTFVRQGLTCLHSGWDFEAYRQFCAALKLDSQCLMAHWGVVVSLLQGGMDLSDEREAALARMLALTDQGVGSDLERRYVYGIVKLLADGGLEAGNAFAKMVNKYPNDPQARLMKCLFTRGGYDESGLITPDQERAEKELRELANKHPEMTYLRYALLAIRAEAPLLKKDLGMARALCTEVPNFAPYQHLLGHYEWRCGNPSEAQNAFARAADLYSMWMKANGLTAIDCPEWTKAECYRAVALSSKGEYDSALAVAKTVAAIEVPEEMAGSKGARMLLWEGRTLGVRILLRRAGAGDMKLALTLLPAKDVVGGFGGKSLVVWSYQAYSAVVTGRLAIKQGDLKAARVVSDDISRLGANYVKVRTVAVGSGERSEWLRNFKAMEVMASELRGLIAMAGPKADRGAALNWYRSATGRQTRATLMMPPAVLLPMPVRLGEYFQDKGELQLAIDELLEGRETWQGDWELLSRLQFSFEKAKMSERVEEVKERIKKLQE